MTNFPAEVPLLYTNLIKKSQYTCKDAVGKLLLFIETFFLRKKEKGFFYVEFLK